MDLFVKIVNACVNDLKPLVLQLKIEKTTKSSILDVDMIQCVQDLNVSKKG